MNIKTWDRFAPQCKYIVWIVDYGTGSTSNPMTKRAAVKLATELKLKNPDFYKNISLIQAWSCVSAKNLMKIN